MDELTETELTTLLQCFAVLLLAFAANFHFSKKSVRIHHRSAVVFVSLNLIGEISTVIALLLTWVAIWSPAAWERIDNLLVFIPGTIAVGCAVLLTFASVYGRFQRVVHIRANGPDSDEARKGL